MARFYVGAQGSGCFVKRLGGAGTGANTVAAGWSGAVRCRLYAVDGLDRVSVTLGQWRGAGQQPAVTLYDGPLGSFEPDPDCACGLAEAIAEAADA